MGADMCHGHIYDMGTHSGNEKYNARQTKIAINAIGKKSHDECRRNKP